MDAERLTAVMEAMVPRVYEANSYIIQEGEIGSHFYVSAQGTFEVLKDSKSVIKSFGSGVVFGELAILYKARRFASIRVTEASKVWMLERKVFQKIMMRSGKRERDQNIKFLSSVSVLKDLPASVLSQISDLLKRVGSNSIFEFHNSLIFVFFSGILSSRRYNHSTRRSGRQILYNPWRQCEYPENRQQN